MKIGGLAHADVKYPLYDQLDISIERSIESTVPSPFIYSKETTKLIVIGSAHNQFEYYLKQRQNCTTIMLSPIFYNDKYSNHKILNQIKFNLITLNWKTKICALGGISYKNIMLINLTKSTSIGVKSFITKKKPAHN